MSTAGNVVLGLTCGALLAAFAPACSSHTPVTYTVLSPPRDWAAHPAVVDVPAPSPAPAAPADLYAVSDAHGGYDRLAALLAGAGILAAVPPDPSSPTWKAGAATLVVVGDLIDKGPQPLEVMDLFMALEGRAAAAGGRVVVLAGNHEAEFFADPGNSKADGTDGVDKELRARGIDPVALASGKDPHGQWLRDRPFAARIGAWFFAHAGDTHGRSVGELDALLRAAVEAHPNYADANLTGADSLLESRDWYGDTAVAPRYLAALGAKHIVFGHDPNALGARGAIAVAQDGALLRVDCGMSPDVNDSTGKVLHVRKDGTDDVAEELDAQGNVRLVWRGPS